MRAKQQQSHEDEREREQARFRWLSTAQAGEIAGGVTDDTVRGWIEKGDLRAFNAGSTGKPRYRIKPEWLEAFEAKRTRNEDTA